MKYQEEIPFSSGESNNQVVKVGNSVRRALTQNSDLVHQVMIKLTQEGFYFSPKYLGIDEKGREIISFIPGSQMNHEKVTISLAEQSMSALKQFHDILSDPEFSGDHETICHTDFAPWNLIVQGNKLVGVIDFDDISPGERLDDVAYACWTFLKIGEYGTDEQFIYTNLPKLIKAYGELDTDDFVETLFSEQNRILRKREARVLSARGRKERADREKICKEIRVQIKWVQDRRNKISSILHRI